MSMKRSPQWYSEYQLRLARSRRKDDGVANVELVSKQAAGLTALVPRNPDPKERYPNLLLMFAEARIPPPATEWRFDEQRKWRFDYAWPAPHRIALEVDGGVWNQGRHTRAEGFKADQEKRNAAVIAGWRVIHTTPDNFVDAVRTVKMLMGWPA